MAAGRLGCASETTAFVTFQCGTPRVCTLTNAASITWNRVLDDISEAEVVVPIGNGIGGVNPCCECLGDIEPWCHELHIVRDGVEVWTGPIHSVEYGYTTVTIRAKDVLSWLAVRIPIGVFGNANNLQEITDLAKQILDLAFAEHDPCVTPYIYQTDLTPKNTRPTYLGPLAVSTQDFTAFDNYYIDWLHKLSDIGLDFTALGRRIILGVDAADLPIAGQLTDEHILGEISITKNGDLMANRVYVRYEKDDDAATCTANALAGNAVPATVPCPVLVEGPQYCYGPIDTVLPNQTATTVKIAKQIGQVYVNTTSIAPRTVNFPQGSKLSPDAPFDINELIPGQKIRLAITGLCLETFSEFKLTGIGFSLQSGGDEEITITAEPTHSARVAQK